METKTKNKKKKITEKSLKTFATIFIVVGVLYILCGIYSFYTTISGYVSQGYAMSEVLVYLGPSQFLPNVILPAFIFGGFSIAFYAFSEILSKLPKTEEELASETIIEEKADEVTEEVEVIEEAIEEETKEEIEEDKEDVEK